MNLRNPKFGNIFINNENTTVTATVDGQRIIIRPASWPQLRQFSIAIEALSLTTKLSLMQFYQMSAGQLIQIVDHEKNIWEGFILDPKPSIRQSRPGCGYETNFTFEGQIIGVEP